MKDGIREIIGKKVAAVVVGEGQEPPTSQVFLVFDDGTYFELYGRSIQGAGGLDRGDLERARKDASWSADRKLQVFTAE